VSAGAFLWGLALLGLGAVCLGLLLSIIDDSEDGMPDWLRQDTIDGDES
jgi:hypothetical protein